MTQVRKERTGTLAKSNKRRTCKLRWMDGSSLWMESLDGGVVYNDINRVYCVDIEDVSSTYHSGTGSKIVDEMFPITMPYMPGEGRYVVYEQTFLVDEANGDFDTKCIIYMETPEGERIDIYRYFTEKNGKFEEISKEKYDVLLAKRIDKMQIKVADNLLFTLISNSASEKEIDRREMQWKSLLLETRNGVKEHLQKLCNFFEKEENYKYNTFHYRQLLCSDNFDEIKDVPELIEIGNYLRDILKVLVSRSFS